MKSIMEGLDKGEGAPQGITALQKLLMKNNTKCRKFKEPYLPLQMKMG
jgi:hypothetical protein